MLFYWFVNSVPPPSIEIIALNQTVGQSLTLESTITTVRGISPVEWILYGVVMV